MKIMVLGAGMMGSAAVKDLVKSNIVSEVVLASKFKKEIDNVASKIGSEKLSTTIIDAMDPAALSRLLRREDVDVVINALPHEISLHVLRTEVNEEVNVVDLTFEDEYMSLHQIAQEKDVIVVPGCGVAPGLSNMLVGYVAGKLEKARIVKIMVGGLPQKPKPPLEYRIVFNLESVWQEYTEKVRIVRNGKVVEVEALSGLEEIYIPKIGELECFYTDGLASLIFTYNEIEPLKNVEEMCEKTIRYPGHVQKIKTLIECGLLDTEPIEIKSVKISPREFLTNLLTPKLQLREEKDFTIMKIKVVGEARGENVEYIYDLIDYYDEKEKVTSMARTTAYTASIMAQLIGQSKIKEKGIIPPEKIGLKQKIFQIILDELAKRNIKIEETVTI
ncbi:MAG: saccharopine dehydrogenase family protein [Candidatus Baldrarchaeia archaeon]